MTITLAPVMAFAFDPPVYFAREIGGKVVDESTGQPLRDAILVAGWKLAAGGIGHSASGGSLKTLEAVTDAEGKYHFDGWGPAIRLPLSWLEHLDPEIVVFKPGYMPLILSNPLYSYANHNQSMVRTSQWDGKVIGLAPFNGDWKDYWTKLSAIWSPFGSCVAECPKLILALDVESRRIRQAEPRLLEIVPSYITQQVLKDSER